MRMKRPDLFVYHDQYDMNIWEGGGRMGAYGGGSNVIRTMLLPRSMKKRACGLRISNGSGVGWEEEEGSGR